MIYYLLAATIPLFVWGIRNYYFNKYTMAGQKKERAEKWFVFFAILPIFLLYVLRDSHIGADTIGYVSNFQGITGNLIEVWQNADKEPGFLVYTRLVSLLSRNYTVYFFITGLLIFVPIYFFSVNYPQNPYVFIFLFITLGYYSFIETGMRQAIAMSICLTSYGAIKKKNLINIIRTVLTITIAYFFHKSAVIFVLLFILSFLPDSDISKILYLVITIVLASGFSFFQDLFNEWVGYSYEIEETGNGYIFLLVILGLYIISAVWGKKDIDVDVNRLIANSASLTVVMWVLRLISRTAERISYYFILGHFAYATKIFAFNKHSKDMLILRLGIIFICIALFVYRNVDAKYAFFWQGIL